MSELHEQQTYGGPVTYASHAGEFDYIRRYYGVPAYIGQRVIADGHPGEIVDSLGHYIVVKLDDRREPGPWHPTWHMGYVAKDGAVERFDSDTPTHCSCGRPWQSHAGGKPLMCYACDKLRPPHAVSEGANA